MTTTPPHRRWFRFTLRTMFVVMTLLAISFAWWANTARRQKMAVVAILDLDPNVRIYYDYEAVDDATYGEFNTDLESAVPKIFLSALGRDYFHNATGVVLDDCGEVIIANLVQLRRIKSIMLKQPSEISMRALAKLPNLECLELGITIWVSGFFGPMPNPIVLRGPTAQTDQSGPQLSDLPVIPSLKILSSEIVNSDPSAACVARCSRLEHFQTSSDSYSNQGLQQLATLKRLKWLRIAAPGVTDDGLPSLLNLKDLEYLELAQAKVTADGLMTLRALPNLKELVCPHGVTQDLPALRAALPNCSIAAN